MMQAAREKWLGGPALAFVLWIFIVAQVFWLLPGLIGGLGLLWGQGLALRAGYAAMIGAGDYWSDAQIACDLDPGQLATCVHLAPTERADREAGLAPKPASSPLHVDARRRIECRSARFNPFRGAAVSLKAVATARESCTFAGGECHAPEG
jgi:hypothetical protein